MSAPDDEAHAVLWAWMFLTRIAGDKTIGPKSLRQEARAILKHYPPYGDLAAAAKRYAPKLLSKVEREADTLAHEAAREAARANAAESSAARPSENFLNTP